MERRAEVASTSETMPKPKSDYDLVTKRVQELIKIGQSVYVQDDTIGDQTPSD